MISIVILTHNRLESLKRCIKSIQDNTVVPYEIIVVDNASTDGTKEWLSQKRLCDCMVYGDNMKVICNDVNEGVCTRNKGFEIARGEYIAQIDDDVTVHKGWDTTSLQYIEEGDNVGVVGVQGSLIREWLNYDVWKNNNTYCDVVCGYFFVMKNIGMMYDSEHYHGFWEEDSALCLDIKSKGYRIRQIPMVCTHVSLRNTPVDWTQHNDHRDYLKNKWINNLDVLRLGGN